MKSLLSESGVIDVNTYITPVRNLTRQQQQQQARNSASAPLTPQPPAPTDIAATLSRISGGNITITPVKNDTKKGKGSSPSSIQVREFNIYVYL